MKYPAGVLFCTALAMAAIAADSPKAKAPTDADLIKSAMSAAPMSVAKNATVVNMTADEPIKQVREPTDAKSCSDQLHQHLVFSASRRASVKSRISPIM